MQDSSLWDWARLVRLPNVFTVLADVSAAFLLVSHSAAPSGRFICVLLAGVCLYWAGMILNDVFDIDVDRRERPLRPLPDGRISLSAARTTGWGLLFVGVVLAALSGYLPGEDVVLTWRGGLIGILLGVMIVLYDGPLKRTPLAPLAMGLCRMLSFLLGASPALAGPLPQYLFEPHVLAAAAGFGIYIMGVTWMARHETGVTSKLTLVGSLIILLAGCAVLAYSPNLAPPGTVLHIGQGPFALLVVLLAATFLYRAAGAVVDPRPQRVQVAVKAALLTFIPLAAAVALLGAGPFYGLAVFGLVFPAILLASRFRMT